MNERVVEEVTQHYLEAELVLQFGFSSIITRFLVLFFPPHVVQSTIHSDRPKHVFFANKCFLFCCVNKPYSGS